MKADLAQGGLIDIDQAGEQPVQYLQSNLTYQKKPSKFNQTFLQLLLWLLVFLPAQVDLLLLQLCFTSLF